MKSSVKALVRVEVTIPGDSNWAQDTTIEQVKKQALDDFQNTIRRINSPSTNNIGVAQHPVGIKIIGEPRVEMFVLAPDEE